MPSDPINVWGLVNGNMFHYDISVSQVWNVNACNAVVGAFNLQGSAWDRSRRQYRTYTNKAPILETEVRVRDVPLLLSNGTRRTPLENSSSANFGNSENGSGGARFGNNSEDGRECPDALAVPRSWVAVLSGDDEIHRLREDDGIPLRLAGGDYTGDFCYLAQCPFVAALEYSTIIPSS